MAGATARDRSVSLRPYPSRPAASASSAPASFPERVPRRCSSSLSSVSYKTRASLPRTPPAVPPRRSASFLFLGGVSSMTYLPLARVLQGFHIHYHGGKMDPLEMDVRTMRNRLAVPAVLCPNRNPSADPTKSTYLAEWPRLFRTRRQCRSRRDPT